MAPAAPAILPEPAQRLITELSCPHDVVADVMCGSGSLSLAAARPPPRGGLGLEPGRLAQTAAHLAYVGTQPDRQVLESVEGDARLAAESGAATPT